MYVIFLERYTFIQKKKKKQVRAIPLAARALSTILTGLTTGLLSGGINKAISGDGLYLAPDPSFVEGDGLFL